ncbi:MAG TPA: PDDEXK nuclease domain-containing protein, partial [bacterium]|nr:PDDEXK nuclease domain-containing protein [bacterium]
NLLNELKSILNKGLARAYKAVDNIKVQTYWQIGERIVREEIENKERADYGQLLVKNLSMDTNIGESLLYEIIRFYKAYPIFHTVCGELSWSHYGHLIKIENPEKRNFYQQKAVDFSWSVRELKDKINSQLYENSAREEIGVSQTRKLDARDVGQMNKYVSYFRINRQYEHEKETIGLIICSEAGIEEAQYALGVLEEKIFIATYQPKLPTMEQLKKAVKRATE